MKFQVSQLQISTSAVAWMKQPTRSFSNIQRRLMLSDVLEPSTSWPTRFCSWQATVLHLSLEHLFQSMEVVMQCVRDNSIFISCRCKILSMQASIKRHVLMFPKNVVHLRNHLL